MSASKQDTSPDRLRANRENARKSTGPRTPAGKDRSRQNALAHGLAGQGVVLPPATRQALDDQLAQLNNRLQPADDLEQTALRTLALAALRLEYCGNQELALQASDRRQALASWDLTRRQHAEYLGSQLATDPPGIQLSLRCTSEGCRWLISRWQTLRTAIELEPWSKDDLHHAFDLLGLPRPRREFNPRARNWSTRLDSLRHHRPEAPDALATLLRYIDRQIKGLDDRARLLWKKVEAADHAALAQGTAFLPTANRQLLNRYENTASRSLARAQSLLKNLRNDRAEQHHSPTPEASTPLEPEPKPEPASTPQSELAKPSHQPPPPAPKKPTQAPTLNGQFLRDPFKNDPPGTTYLDFRITPELHSPSNSTSIPAPKPPDQTNPSSQSHANLHSSSPAPRSQTPTKAKGTGSGSFGPVPVPYAVPEQPAKPE